LDALLQVAFKRAISSDELPSDLQIRNNPHLFTQYNISTNNDYLLGALLAKSQEAVTIASQ
jgi:hypothetical protein